MTRSIAKRTCTNFKKSHPGVKKTIKKDESLSKKHKVYKIKPIRVV